VSSLLVVRFEDAHIAVVDKPAGIHTAPLHLGGEAGTLLEAILARYPEVAKVQGFKPEEPGLLHRLDRETSGLVVVARTTAAFTAMRERFNSTGVRKGYSACCALPSEARPVSEGLLSITSRFAPRGLGRSMVRVVLPDEAGRRVLREATPDAYRTEARITRQGMHALLLEAGIERGFRHQVRVHLAFLGYPIIGDPLYGTAVPGGASRRMYLHASYIELVHPMTDEPLCVQSPLPPEFQALLG
jgi:23S rRNA pseudouridine1911/1915/1917 synthase